MADKRKSNPSTNKTISIHGDVKDSAVIIGDNNTVNQTIIQKFFNIFKSDSETLEQRNRRILLGHVENAWIKGVLDASLHGAALLDLGIKQDPEAVTKYPWAIKKESTDEILPAGTSMLEIFDSIGMGRSLLILGAPGSGKTTMLLELTRQLIERAREDVTQPIPMVFNLSSWTESKTLADWLAQELNNLYSVPRKTAPDWVKGDKLLLLLDGLDEVRQDSRAKCVEAINAFRKDHGLTSLAVCSRSQDYADLNAKLSFEGAIEVQPLTQEQITEFFNRFGKEMAGIKQVLKKDSALHEMAETPLFLSIMLFAYRNMRGKDILTSKKLLVQRKYLFNTYIERMFERPRSKNMHLEKQAGLNWLSWLASKMIEHNAVPYALEEMQPTWLDKKKHKRYRYALVLISELFFGLILGLVFGVVFGLISKLVSGGIFGLTFGLVFGLFVGTFFGLLGSQSNQIYTIDFLSWSWSNAIQSFSILIMVLLTSGLFAMIVGAILGLIIGAIFGIAEGLRNLEQITLYAGQSMLVLGLLGLIIGVIDGLGKTSIFWKKFRLTFGLQVRYLSQPAYFGQKIVLTIKNSLILGAISLLLVGLIFGWSYGLMVGIIFGLVSGIIVGIKYGGLALIQHYSLRFILSRNNLLPWRLVPFLNHCVDLIFLRRVGGGYIFVHRLLMEHFAEMYVDTPTSKGN